MTKLFVEHSLALPGSAKYTNTEVTVHTLYKLDRDPNQFKSDHSDFEVSSFPCTVWASQLEYGKSHIWETPNLLTEADSSTNIFVSAGVKKGAHSIFLARKRKKKKKNPS